MMNRKKENCEIEMILLNLIFVFYWLRSTHNRRIHWQNRNDKQSTNETYKQSTAVSCSSTGPLSTAW
jgi:hypothetical protein